MLASSGRTDGVALRLSGAKRLVGRLRPSLLGMPLLVCLGSLSAVLIDLDHPISALLGITDGRFLHLPALCLSGFIVALYCGLVVLRLLRHPLPAKSLTESIPNPPATRPVLGGTSHRRDLPLPGGYLSPSPTSSGRRSGGCNSRLGSSLPYRGGDAPGWDRLCADARNLSEAQDPHPHEPP